MSKDIPDTLAGRRSRAPKSNGDSTKPNCLMCMNNTRIPLLNTETTMWAAKAPQNLLDKTFQATGFGRDTFLQNPFSCTAGLLLFGFVWEFSLHVTVPGMCRECVQSQTNPSLPFPPKFMEAQVDTKERSQPLELRLRHYLLKSYWVQRWIKQGEHWDYSSKRTLDVVYNFPFFPFFWPFLRAKPCWSTRNGL